MTDAFRVALTFDAEHPDRPHHGDHAAWVLDELRRLDVRATIFLQGRWVEAFPELAARVSSAGHLIGNHSHYHARMPLLSKDGFAEDVREAQAMIVSATGVDPRPWIRFPFGAGAHEPKLLEWAAGLGYRHVGWDVEVYEWEPSCTVSDVVSATLDGVRAHGDGAIVLLHTWPDPVAPALAGIVGNLRDAGARFVGLDDLTIGSGLEPVAPPPAPLPVAAG